MGAPAPLAAPVLVVCSVPDLALLRLLLRQRLRLRLRLLLRQRPRLRLLLRLRLCAFCGSDCSDCS